MQASGRGQRRLKPRALDCRAAKIQAASGHTPSTIIGRGPSAKHTAAAGLESAKVLFRPAH